MRKKAFYIIDTVWAIILYILPLMLIFSLRLSNVLVILFLIISIVSYLLNKDRLMIDFRTFIIMTTPFLLTVLGLTYASDLKLGWKEVETRIPILIFPLIFSLKYPTPSQCKWLSRSFIFSLLLTFSYCLVMAVYRNSKDPGYVYGRDTWFNKWYYQYSDFTDPAGIDTLYISLFIGFGILILILEEMNVYKSVRSNKIQIAIWILLLMIFLAMIGSRSIIILLIVIIMGIMILSLKRLSKKVIIALTLSIVFFIGIVYALPVTRDRFVGLFTTKYNFSNYSIDRFVIWSTAWSYVKDHPNEFVIGHGTGTAAELMDEVYNERKIDWDFKQKSNTHNQYIDFLLNFGLIGILILVGFLIYSLHEFGLSRNWIGVVFIVYFSMSLINENFLNRQKGVVFFSVCYSLLFLSKGRK